MIKEQTTNGTRLSRQECETSKEMKKQCDALDADEYLVNLLKEDSAGNLDNRQDEMEYKYSADELIRPKVVRMLNVKNYKDGYSLFVTPYSQRHSYLLLNDMTTVTKEKMKSDGYTFAMTSEISPNLIQCVLKLDAQGYSEQKLQTFSSQLNKEYGASDIGTQLHLAGFQNINPKPHAKNDKGSFITLKEFTGRICKYAKQKFNEMIFSIHPEGSK